MTLNRRQFIHSTAATGLALTAAPFIHAAPKAKQYRTALIGSGWWGMNILKEAMSGGQCKAVALCDVDQDALELAAEEVNDLSGDSPKTYGDFRELLDEEKIDIGIRAHGPPCNRAEDRGAFQTLAVDIQARLVKCIQDRLKLFPHHWFSLMNPNRRFRMSPSRH